MNQYFWNRLSKPFFAMAPLANVTDAAFRALVAHHGPPDVFWTEFVSADGLYHTREIQKLPDEASPLMRDLAKGADERPIVAQLFSAKPEMIAYGAALAHRLGFDGVDLNMGCPDRSVEKQGAGAALIKTPAVARALIRAAKSASPLPVSVKTRVGYRAETLETWLPELFAERPAALTLHLRTREELSLVPARWELMRTAVALRDRLAPDTLLIGNGDATDLTDARAKAAAYGCDGVMLGRAMFGNPWLFSGRKDADTPPPEKLAALLELARGFETLSPPKSFPLLKKHVKAFVSGFDGAAELRAKLMQAESADELATIARKNAPAFFGASAPVL